MNQMNKLTQTLTTALASTLCACATPQAPASNAATASTQAFKPQIHVFESDASGFNTRTVFYDNGREVVAFDSQFTPDQARKSIEFLRSRTSNPIRFLVVTHPNPDKYNAIAEFQKEGAKVVASQSTAAGMPTTHAYKKYFFVNIAKMFTEETYPQLARPDLTFEKSMKLELDGGDSIELKELSQPGVSTTQTVALVPSAKALIVGDLVHFRTHAWLEGGIGQDGKPHPELAGWIRDLEEVKSIYGSQQGLKIYGGRGEAAPLAQAVDEQISYLKKADQLVTKYVRDLGNRRAELNGNEAGRHFEAITQIFEKEFPAYALPYMIQYSVYGLAGSKL